MNAPARSLRDTEIAGVRLPATLILDDQPLQLNGAGVRSLLLLKVYVAALYVARPSRQAEELIRSPYPRRLELVIKRSIDASMILDNFHKAMRQNLPREVHRQLEPRFGELDSAIRNIKHTRDGDRLWLDFTAGGDTRISFNGEHRETLAGEGLAHGLLNIWLGPRPAQDSLKKALLGG